MNQEAYIFAGPPGSGKGSLSKLCSLYFGWRQLSTGNLCRKHITEQTSIGKEIDFIIKSGKLISNDLMTSMVDAWISESIGKGTSFILDGFPRNMVQAQSLLSLIDAKYPSLKITVVKFMISDNVAIDRMCTRYICQNSECQMVYSNNEQSGLAPKKALECDYCLAPLGKRTDDDRDVVIERLQTYRSFEQEMFASLVKYQHVEINVECPLSEVFEIFKESIKEA